jgi:3-hydroxy-9,10-secoandrosta-1,3,5(10)-triene-9,17-dione monooxygenase
VRQIHRNVADQMECVEAQGYPDAELMLRTRRDQVMASDRAARAIGAIVADPGHGVDERLVERVWRDVQTARMHVASNVEQVLSVAGRFTLGLDVGDLIW